MHFAVLHNKHLRLSARSHLIIIYSLIQKKINFKPTYYYQYLNKLGQYSLNKFVKKKTSECKQEIHMSI